MNVGVISGLCVAAVLALPAGSWLLSGADEALPQPERQPLLANPRGALEQTRRRERIPPDRIIEPASDGVVAVQWE